MRSILGSSSSARLTPAGPAEPASSPPDIKTLSAQLNTAVAQQQWQQAIHILDQMIPWVPHQQVELSAYRENLSALAGTTP